MAAKHYRYKKDTLEWTPAGGSAVPITGVQSIRFGEGGEVTDLVSDASELVQELPLSKIKGRITVTTLAQGVANGLALGGGALTFNIEQVRNGRGSVSGEELVVDFGACVLRDKDSGAATAAGEGTTLAFEAADDGSGDIYTIADAP